MLDETTSNLPELEDRLQHFQTLMPHRVEKILLVASPYDSFLLGEYGKLDQANLNELMELSLKQAPGLSRVSTGSEALAKLRKQRFDLVITSLHIGDMEADRLAHRIKKHHPDLPVVLLAFDDRELEAVTARGKPEGVDRVFVWHGDFRILMAIVKTVEDGWNVAEDVELAGVSVIILIEDSVRYYSQFLPDFYTELMMQSERVIAEGVNLTHKVMRMRARPKILLCTSYEEAEANFRLYRDVLLGVISDVDFPRGGKSDPDAGLDFARMVRKEIPDLPIMLQTRDAPIIDRAREVEANVLLKDSPLLLRELRRFMLENFGFGDFVFRDPEGREVKRAGSLRAMEAVLPDVPDDSVFLHASRNHFSIWLRARTEFRLAQTLRRRDVSEFNSVADVRHYLVESIREFRRERQSGVVAHFEKESFDPAASFAKIGTGSMGGKARGLAFVRQLLYNHRVRDNFPGVRIAVPPAVVIATDVFDRFMDENDLRDFALSEPDDEAIENAFLRARFPRKALGALYRYLDKVKYPLAVRSSSLMEDSQHQPFAGIYRTVMVPNTKVTLRDRRRAVVRAIKRVYASTFTASAKAYFKTTAYRHEEEKMAVIIQRVGGAQHGDRFYPEIAGVARSHNFYPIAPMQADDGIASVALGLGKTVVDGGRSYRFCPSYPERLLDAGSPRDLLPVAQTRFYALELDPAIDEDREPVGSFTLEVAREDQTLDSVASVYSPENDAVYDGLARPGSPFVSMAPVLKYGVFPLADVIRLLLEIGERGMNMPVEIEFAVNLSPPAGKRMQFLLLQLRPMVLSGESERVKIGRIRPETTVARSERVLGHGRIDGIRDLVVVDRDEMDRADTPEIALQVGRFNAELVEARLPYGLIGVGRWGSSEPWLGIPVTWDQIAGARVIVEAEPRDLHVAPSQGSHFFHNLTSSLVGYFTVNSNEGFVDWEWLRGCETVETVGCVRHIRFREPVTVIMDSRTGKGVILKPGISHGNKD